MYKSHGKHCHLRSFPTKCPRCGAEVLYWECRHGSKIFFNYPPYGKLIQHHCQTKYKKSRKNKYPVIIKKPLNISSENSPCCPACGKMFKTEEDREQHLKDSSKLDDLHILYFQNKITLQSSDKEDKQWDLKNKDLPKFGRINIKIRKETNK